jgi:hypothetical protein
MIMSLKLGFAAFVVSALLSSTLAFADAPDTNARITAMLTPKSTCNIISFQEAFDGHVASTNGPVIIGLEDVDPENCGGGGMMPPTLKIVGFERIGSSLRQLNSAGVDGTMRVQKIENAKIVGSNIVLKLLVFGPNDPMCCAKTVTSEELEVRGDRLVRVG